MTQTPTDRKADRTVVAECFSCRERAFKIVVFLHKIQDHDWKRGPRAAEVCRRRGHDVRPVTGQEGR
jgi:hypothetical protein